MHIGDGADVEGTVVMAIEEEDGAAYTVIEATVDMADMVDTEMETDGATAEVEEAGEEEGVEEEEAGEVEGVEEEEDGEEAEAEDGDNRS
uniref:Uncharacterized protein n=1 Tax=Pristionchus pacificus TaxID=54126 RepID=A0A2A6C500_PRIPA|eukprot:PDM73123.1 hypothetical protein PRIPAC_39557 [Pristionchus pacificus]